VDFSAAAGGHLPGRLRAKLAVIESRSRVVHKPSSKPGASTGAKGPVPGLGRQNTVLIIALVCLILSVAAAIFARQSLDYPAVMFLNRFATRSVLFDYVMIALNLDLVQGAVLVAGIWLVWFEVPEPASRARVAAGAIAASFAGLTSRGLQLVLPPFPRPIHDAALPFVHPHGVSPEPLRYYDAFPSDHATLLFGLAMAIVIIRPGVGVAAFAWALIVSLSRVYVGYHFISDITGGAALGVAIVCVSQLPAIRCFCLVFTRWATERPGAFYAVAFLATFSVASMFDDIRAMGKGLTKLLH
jgi:membrane-associated phospholipid phosphatase